MTQVADTRQAPPGMMLASLWGGIALISSPKEDKESFSSSQSLPYWSTGSFHQSTTTMSQKSQVIQLYKNLLYLGREYPMGYEYFREKLKNAFLKNRNETDPRRITEMIARGEYVIKEIEALYMLRKYRTLKRRYYDTEDANKQATN
ncbi:LYR motif-containing protein 5 [Portunus trituberculatus]|uniref:LYR motif-containing protein 5 n=1 Tax=Portunus trituberculatus TaxID=210409 RepID=A0A5B7EID2_PORTR|nr:LYR motif-containing protein 5 [Portunus trituberculatus]